MKYVGLEIWQFRNSRTIDIKKIPSIHEYWYLFLVTVVLTVRKNMFVKIDNCCYLYASLLLLFFTF